MQQTKGPIGHRLARFLGMLGGAVLIPLAACSSGHSAQVFRDAPLPTTASRASGTGHATPAASAAAASHCGHGFELVLASPTGGSPSPEAAAQHQIARHTIPGLTAPPTAAWEVLHREGREATVAAGTTTLQAIEGPDNTWQINGGTFCT
jgi:hypothetical protein